MQKKNELTIKQMADFADWYFLKHFKKYGEAAKYFETHNSVITEVIQGKRAPTDKMLLAFGYTKEKVYKRIKS